MDSIDIQNISSSDTEEFKKRHDAEEFLQSYRVEEESSASVNDDSDAPIERPFNPKEINIKSKTMSLDNIIKRIRESEIDMAPDFQRKGDLWTPDKQSRLIESMLIKLPLPAFYFDGTEDEKWLVVDGLQRLSAIKNFVVDESLRLQGLEFLENISGKTFSELPRNYRRMIEETEIVAYIINPGTPADVKFNIFKRINTGGLVLEPQEIRHALNQGIPSKFVAQLARLDSFREATQNVIATDRMLDREFVTRFLAFYLNGPKGYKPDLDTFMSSSMGQLNNKTNDELDNIRVAFDKAMKLSKIIFDRWAFRKVYSTEERRKPINKALFEVWSVELANLTMEEQERATLHKGDIFREFTKLMNNDDMFVASITSATGDKGRVNYRYNKIHEILYKCISDDYKD
jgi:hypothetical protein